MKSRLDIGSWLWRHASFLHSFQLHKNQNSNRSSVMRGTIRCALGVKWGEWWGSKFGMSSPVTRMDCAICNYILYIPKWQTNDLVRYIIRSCVIIIRRVFFFLNMRLKHEKFHLLGIVTRRVSARCKRELAPHKAPGNIGAQQTNKKKTDRFCAFQIDGSGSGRVCGEHRNKLASRRMWFIPCEWTFERIPYWISLTLFVFKTRIFGFRMRVRVCLFDRYGRKCAIALKPRYVSKPKTIRWTLY